MKSVKLTKKLLNSHPAVLLEKLGAVSSDKRNAYPSHVYLSKNDYKTMTRSVAQMVKKEFPYISSEKAKMAVGMEMLNLGPNESLGDAIKDGYALVDEDAIQKENSILQQQK